ncbi:MAG: AsmA family protein [Bacteroidia bacterium]|nr:AsmA family protein [Bacteroidia bacterium]NNF32322.1 AsmA family protein [Flavobacteriaceae bacterium]MBT8276122.1 AsmA family protein [Bacteroidia bacterium]NNJ81989.1 AsmA family protein [Flavobacteriaceae bacterium]NNK53948.1 AsmA family protein [Flavobacteriaceae bacterium]
MKKFLKIIGVLLGLFIIVLIAAPFLFKGTLEDLLKKNLNDNLNAEVAWESMDLSLFSSFPDAAVKIKNFSVVNNAPFEGDTLASGERLTIDMGITQLFKSGNDPIKINALSLDQALVNIKVDSLGRANYDIAIEKDTPEENTSEFEDEGFTFELNGYEINNSTINYLDEVSKTFLMLSEMNHSGKGDFSLDLSELDTETDAVLSLQIGDVKYLTNNLVSLDALIQMDLVNQKYTFLENEARINELLLTFDGFVKVNENDSELDLMFKTPSSDFRNFLAVIPKQYVKNLDGVSTTGDFSVNGMLKGVVDDNLIPKMDIAVKSSNASFKYPDLPKAVRNISIDARLKNETGLVEDTYLNIGGLTFKIDKEIFSANGSIRNITKNAIVNMVLKGTLNLANIEQVLPLELEQGLSGVFKADVTTNFDMSSIENEQYQNIRTNGTASLSNFTYKDPDFKNELKIETVSMDLSPGNIKLKELKGSTGETDVAATGTIQNLVPWIMAKQDLKGRFDVQSNTFNLNDFKSADTEVAGGSGASSGTTVSDDQIKIPDFLDATLDFTANKVIYDDITLTNTKGTVSIREETANLNNVTSDLFGGNAALSGNVSTKEKIPTFAMDLDLSKINISESFQSLALLKYLAPVAKALDGDLNTKIQLNGFLDKNLSPDLKSLAGNAAARILTAEVTAARTPILAKIGQQAPFLQLDKLSLKDVSTAFTFNNGKIEVQPFSFDVEGVNVTASGSHGLDKSMNYSLDMDVPAKYLGTDVTNLLSKLDPLEANSMRVNVPMGVSGSVTDPKISINMGSAVNSITQKLIEKQKQELTEKGTDILKDLIGGNETTGKDPKNDNTGTKTDPVNTDPEKIVKGILGDLLKGNKKKDSVKN